MPYPTLTYYPVEHLSNGQMIFHDNHEFRGIGDTKCGIHTEWCKSCPTDEMVDCPTCYPPESPFGTLDYRTEYYKLREGIRSADYYLRCMRFWREFGTSYRPDNVAKNLCHYSEIQRMQG